MQDKALEFLTGSACKRFRPALAAAVFAFVGAVSASERLPASQPVVKERRPHESRVEYVEAVRDEAGRVSQRTNSYVVLGTGLNRWDAARREWLPANNRIEIVNGYGIARGVQHRVVLAPNTRSAGGLVDLETPEGERIVLQPVGLAITDGQGRSVFLAEVQESAGVLVEPNVMVYPDAFDLLGGSICVRVGLEGVESDVILSERVDRGLLQLLGVDITSARLEVWHEVIRKPRYSKKVELLKRRIGMQDEDHTIHFGGMSISAGTAFTTGTREKMPAAADLPVAKEFVRVEGIDFLIESVPFLEAEPELQDLPDPMHAAWLPNRAVELARLTTDSASQARTERKRPVSLSRLGKQVGVQRQVAMASQSGIPKGYVIDYPITLTSQTNFTFRGDTTYYITNKVFLYGTTRLEGGAVIKTVPYNESMQAAVRIQGDFECATSPINPAIFTARDDNSVGETVADSTGVVDTNIWYSHFNLMFLGPNPVRAHDIQTRHGHVGFYFGTGGPHYVSNAQVERCYRGIEALNSIVHLRNVLVHDSIHAINQGARLPPTIHGEHLTVHNASNLFSVNGSGKLFLTNSVLCNVGNIKTNVFLERVETVDSAAFKTVGRGHHYLADESPYRNAGTFAISPETAKILQETTTWAPSILTSNISSDITLTQTVERDISSPDLGFHYYPLDYLAGGVEVDAATLTLGPGVNVGVYGANGFVLRNGGSVLSLGEARQMNSIVPYTAVQSDSLEWESPFEGVIRLASSAGPVQMQFTRVAALANAPARRLLISGYTDTTNSMADLDISHSHLANLSQHLRALAPQSIRLFNNIVERCSLTFEQGQFGRRIFKPLTIALHNNLFHQGSLTFTARQGSSSWIVRDNIFNNEQLAASGLNSNFAPDYNAFRTGLTVFGGANNRLGHNPFFEEGPLGGFYLTSESLNEVRDAGSRSAGEAGLFHYTMEPAAFTRDGNSTVDIGFHYAMVDSFGGRPDTDGDGLLDEAEDSNGNGSVDAGETSHSDKDTDWDGVTDPDEIQIGTNPNDSRSVPPRSLSSFRFDDRTLTGVEGQEPIFTTNMSFAAGFDGVAANFSSTNGPGVLRYAGIESNGKPNVSLAQGSFRLRLRTFWVSNDPDLGGTNNTFRGVGPQEWVTLIETTNIAVRIDPQGTNLVLTSRTANGQTFTNLQGKILLDSENFRAHFTQPATSFWNDVLITYSPAETKVYWGTPATALTGTGITPWGGNSSANQFLSIGSAADGSGGIKGLIEDAVIYNVPGVLHTNPWQFSALTVTNPAALNLVWPSKTNTLFNLKRRTLGETNWTWLPGVIGTNYLDTAITAGQRYEYNLNSGFMHISGVPEKFGNTMTASLHGAPIESRGKVLLLVDETLSGALQPELNMLITNLVGDGWTVRQTNVSRHIDDYSTTAAFATNWFNITNRVMPAIRGYYAQFSNELKHILIIGHVTIPYTGRQADDGHSSPAQVYGSHQGPWASDLFYSDMDGIWRDTNIVNDSAFLENRTTAGDGKLDEDYIPANQEGIAEAEVSVARIDFSRLPGFPHSETDLLKRYLQKNARYRHKQLSFEPSVIGADLFFTFQSVIFADQIGTETASKLAPLATHVRGDVFAVTNSFVLGTQSSPGYADRINDARPNMQTTASFATNGLAPSCAFYLFRSSFFQDWNLENNFMRAALTPTNGGLAAGWFISMGVWRMDSLAAGLELGHGWRETVSSRLKPFWGGQSARATQILGDSTLRFPVLAPPMNLSAVRSAGFNTLTWSSPEPNCTYNVYRSSNGITSPFVRLNSAPLTTNSFSEPTPSRATQLYMVRALKLVETGSGSFTNVSQGVFISR